MSFWTCNIDRRGRMLRFASGAILGVAAGLFYFQGQHWAAWILAVAASFTWYEAARGWCVVRAFGFKTRF
jgi:hypothetical protein